MKKNRENLPPDEQKKYDAERRVSQAIFKVNAQKEMPEMKNLGDFFLGRSRFKDLMQEAKDTAQKLSTEFELIDDETREIVTQLFERLKEKYPQLLGIYLMGSRVHGGQEIRKSVGTSSRDLDWGVYLSEELDADTLEGMNQRANHFLAEYAKENSLEGGLKSCRKFNPNQFTTIIENNDADQQEIKNLIAYVADVRTIVPRTPRRMIAQNMKREIWAIFQPSIPPEININRQQKVFKILKEIKDKEPRKFELILERLINVWTESREIQKKHFMFTEHQFKFTDYYYKLKYVEKHHPETFFKIEASLLADNELLNKLMQKMTLYEALDEIFINGSKEDRQDIISRLKSTDLNRTVDRNTTLPTKRTHTVIDQATAAQEQISEIVFRDYLLKNIGD